MKATKPKDRECCLTCKYWGGQRKFDGYTFFEYDNEKPEGDCNQTFGKGRYNSKTNEGYCCFDYEQMYK